MMLKPILIKWAKLILLVTCCLFILFGAVNNGFSRWIPAIPFIFLAIWAAQDFSKKNQMIITGIMVISSWAIWPAEDNSLIYTHIGEPVYLQGDFVSISYTDDPYHYIYDLDEDFQQELLDSRTRFGEGPDEIPKQLVLSGVKTSHPDFYLTLYAILTDNTGKQHFLSEKKFKQGLQDGTITAPESSSLDHFESLQSSWSHWLGMGMMWPAAIFLMIN